MVAAGPAPADPGRCPKAAQRPAQKSELATVIRRASGGGARVAYAESPLGGAVLLLRDGSLTQR